MINPISSGTSPQAIVQPTAVPPPAPKPQPQPVAVPNDTVQLSAAALALQEARETPAQTAREAAAGDLQAKHLLAHEAVAKINR